MDLEVLMNILGIIGYLVLGGLAIWFKSSEKAQKKAEQVKEVMADIISKAVIFIREAEEFYEDTTDLGGLKFDYVVNKLYDLVPDFAKAIITKEIIGDIVQSTFDEIEKYAKLQLDKNINVGE